MKLKSELYKNRQNEICDEIITILDLDSILCILSKSY